MTQPIVKTLLGASLGGGALVAAIALPSLSFAQGEAEKPSVILIKDATVHTLGGDDYAEVIEDGDILISDGVITAVGGDVAAPDGARVIDAEGKIVTPGIFAPLSQLGLVEIGLDAEANDSSPQGDFALSAALDAADGFNPATTLIPINRAGGVTRALVAPSAGGKMFGGKAIIIDLSGETDPIMKRDAAQSVVLGYGGAARAGDTRLGSWAHLREYLDEAALYAANPRDYAARFRSDRFATRDLAALGDVIGGDQPLIVSVNRASELRSLIELQKEYGLKVVVRGGTEAWMVADALADAKIPVILDSLANLPGSFEDLGTTLENAARLHEAGVAVAIEGPGTHNLRLLPQHAGNAVANGLPFAAGLAAITITPAEIYGVADRLGSLEKGKIADIVVWSGDPLEVTTRPEMVFINGVETSLENRQTALRERYRDLSRGDLPPAYRGE